MMTDSARKDPSTFDSHLPVELDVLAEETGVRKAALNIGKLFALSASD